MEFCPQLRFSEPISLEEDEIGLLCGIPGVPGWTSIPLPQRKIHVQRFLQDRGYLRPKLKEEGDKLIITPGEKSRLTQLEVKTIEVTGEEILPPQVPSEWNGDTLTPALLNTIEDWYEASYRRLGFPCGQARATYVPDSEGHVLVTMAPGQDKMLIRNEIAFPGDVASQYSRGVIERSYAFEDRQRYNDELLLLSAKRIEQVGVLQYADLLVDCSDKSAPILLNGDLGKPRLLRIGVGFDTEQLFIGRVSWSHRRLGRNASPLEVRLEGSFRRQELSGNMDWFAFQEAPRFFFRSKVAFTRRYEPSFHLINVESRFIPTYRWDTKQWLMDWGVGPVGRFNRTYDGTALGSRFITAVETVLDVMSHQYEYYFFDQDTGSRFQWSTMFSRYGLVSDVDLTRFDLLSKHFFGFGEVKPRDFVIGIKNAFGSALGGKGEIPPDLLFFIGGANDVRGFSRQSIPDEVPALTRVYLGEEFRFPSLIPLVWKPIIERLEPFVFADQAMLGSEWLTLDSTIYLSVGLGLKWVSAIGPIRLTFAEGFVAGPLEREPNFQVYFSLGEEF